MRGRIIRYKFKLGESPYGILSAPGCLVTYLRMHQNADGRSFLINTPKGNITATDGDTIIAYNDGTLDVIYGQRNIIRGQDEWRC